MFAFACLLAALGASATLPTSPPTPTATLRARQNSGGAIFPDPTAQPIFPDPTTRTTSISSSHPQIVDPPTLASGLQTSATVPVATSMGLIVPAAYPYKEVYAGFGYAMGWVEVSPPHPPIVGGWMREISPAVILPDYSMLPITGSEDPRDAYYYPYDDAMCGSAASSNWINSYPFTLTQEGWHMLVVNQTWMRPTIINGTCHLPLVDVQSLFATHLFSVAQVPTTGIKPLAPTGAYTTWATVTTALPPTLPAPAHVFGQGEKVGIAVGVTAAGVGVIGVVLFMWWLKRRRFIKGERLAFERMKPAERDAYLKENPNSLLNPNSPNDGCFPMPSCFQGLNEEIEAERQRRSFDAAASVKGAWQTKPLPRLPPPGPAVQPLGAPPIIQRSFAYQLPQAYPLPQAPGWYGPVAYPQFAPHLHPNPDSRQAVLEWQQSLPPQPFLGHDLPPSAYSNIT